MAAWVVCAGQSQSAAIRDYLVGCDRGAKVEVVEDPIVARRSLAGRFAGAGVVVGEGTLGPEPVNLAAAIASDGWAREVVLAVGHASGSLRSRANRAGISRVTTSSDVVSYLRPQSLAIVPGGPAGGGPKASAVSSEETRGRAAAPVERRDGAAVIVFVSGRGGVGKSTVAAVAGYIAAGWGMRVALLDLDLAFGNLASLAGAERPGDLSGMAKSELDAGALGEHAVQVAERLRVWGPCKAPEYAETVQPIAADLVALLTHEHDLVIVDTTTNWGDAVASAAQAADRLVIVSDERPGAIPALSRCGGLAVRLGIARTRIVRLMNGCDARRRDEAFVTRAAVGLECAREVRVLDGGEEAVELLSGGHAAELARTDNPLATSLATGLAQLLRELGCLPDSEEAARALEGRRRPRHFLGIRREASSA